MRKIRRRWILLKDVLHKLVHPQIIHCDVEPAPTRCLEVFLGISHPICIEEGCRQFTQFEVYIIGEDPGEKTYRLIDSVCTVST